MADIKYSGSTAANPRFGMWMVDYTNAITCGEDGFPIKDSIQCTIECSNCGREYCLKWDEDAPPMSLRMYSQEKGRDIAMTRYCPNCGSRMENGK